MARKGLATIQGLLETAVQRGELSPALEPSAGVAQLIGPLLFRRLLADEAITPQFIETIVAGFLAGCTNPTQARSSRRAGRVG